MLTTPLHTDRLTLRLPQMEDTAHFADFIASERSRFIGGPGRDFKATSRAWGHAAGLWVLRGYSCFVACLKDGTPIGQMGAWFPATWPEPEFGWSLWDSKHEGQGYVTEAMRTLMPWTWDSLGLTTCVAYIHPDNAASIAVAKRLGGMIDPDAATPDAEPTVTYRFTPAGRT